ncbi:hypothetical protein RI129_010073 [Pyrocoelia pectoralis]|uniref:Kinesin-like protein n=1 Tax=Pyrocoelia pectoralis TaxID=417401 RepID=A0AAN7ZJ60_9COLE
MTGGLPNFNPSGLSSNNSTSSVNSDFQDSSFSSDNGTILVIRITFTNLSPQTYLLCYRIFEGQRNKGAVIIQGIAEITVHNKQDLFKLLQKGLHKRQTASTNMNDRSSRSHAVFSIIVHTREAAEDGEILVKTGKLNLVDLAGSENIGRSGSLERRAREAGNINQSLLTLGRVIKALAENNSHIPFRESKLTRILQDSLGGRTKTVIIATISPCALSIDETLSTLDYAFKARVITNKPEVNQRISQKALITQYVDEIRRLKGDIKAAQTGEGIRMDRDNYNNLVTNVQISIDKVTHSALHIQNLEKELKLLQEEKEQRDREYEALNKSFEETHIELEKEREMCAKIELERRTQEYLANRYKMNATNLYEEAKSLLDIVQSTSSNEALLRNKVEHLYTINNINRDLIQTNSEDVEKLCSASLRDLTSHSAVFSDRYNRIMKLIKNTSDWHKKVCDEVTDLLSFVYSIMQSQCDTHTITVEEACSDLEQLKTKNASQLSLVANSLTSILDTGNLQFYSEMKDLLLIESQRQINFCVNISNRMSELNSLIQSSVEELPVDLNILKNDILNEIQLLSEGIQRKIDINEDGLSQTVDLRNNLLKAIYLGFEAIENDAEKGKEYDGYNMTRSENVQNKLATHTDTILNKLADYSSKTSTICDKEYTEFPDPNSAIEKFESMIQDHVIYFDEQITQTVKNYEDNGTEIGKYCGEICAEHASRLEDNERDMHVSIKHFIIKTRSIKAVYA